MKIKVSINGETHEVEQSDIELPENVNFISPDNVPDGYFTEETVNTMIKDNVNKTEKRLFNDEEHKRKVLTSEGIVLDEEGNPKGLEPAEDIDKAVEQAVSQRDKKHNQEKEELRKKLRTRDEAVIENSIMSAVKGEYDETWTQSFDGEKPLVIEKFKSRIGVDDDGQPYVKNDNGSKMYKGDGVMRPQDYLLDEKFSALMKDKRQKGSNFQNGSKGNGNSATGNPRNWDLKKKNEFIDKNGREEYKKLLDENKN